jgi:hypothetical protein
MYYFDFRICIILIINAGADWTYDEKGQPYLIAPYDSRIYRTNTIENSKNNKFLKLVYYLFALFSLALFYQPGDCILNEDAHFNVHEMETSNRLHPSHNQVRTSLSFEEMVEIAKSIIEQF